VGKFQPIKRVTFGSEIAKDDELLVRAECELCPEGKFQLEPGQSNCTVLEGVNHVFAKHTNFNERQIWKVEAVEKNELVTDRMQEEANVLHEHVVDEGIVPNDARARANYCKAKTCSDSPPVCAAAHVAKPPDQWNSCCFRKLSDCEMSKVVSITTELVVVNPKLAITYANSTKVACSERCQQMSLCRFGQFWESGRRIGECWLTVAPLDNKAMRECESPCEGFMKVGHSQVKRVQQMSKLTFQLIDDAEHMRYVHHPAAALAPVRDRPESHFSLQDMMAAEHDTGGKITSDVQIKHLRVMHHT
jgi:hypothetical protein